MELHAKGVAVFVVLFCVVLAIWKGSNGDMDRGLIVCVVLFLLILTYGLTLNGKDPEDTEE